MSSHGTWRPFLLAVTFTCACLNMLASGSLYVYTLYAPFFTGRLGYSQTQTSLIAVIGDLGLYGAGPVNGFLADHFGPRATSLYAALLIASGYSLLSFTYASGVSRVEQGLPPPSFLLMAFSFLLAGVGSNASYMAAFTSLAKNFKQGRGMALGIPISFFGLSAAVLTLIAQSFFMVDVDQLVGEGGRELDTKGFLLFLGLFGGCANLFSVVGLKILPTPEVSSEARVESNHAHAASPPQVQDEQTPLLRDDVAGAPTQDRHTRTPPSVSGKAFFMDTNAQFFFLVTFCLAGTGLMIINSISAIVDAVAAAKSLFLSAGLVGSLDDPNPVSSTRAIHVTLISVSSYTGRILSGLGSDVAIHRYGAYRTDVLPIASICMALAQLVGMFAPLRWLYLCSILTGLAYGGFFGVSGTIVAELWGEDTCGQNWGWLSWGAGFGGFLFNLLFGVVVDASRPVVDGEPQTCKGNHCFRWALVISFIACLLSCYVSLIMGRRQRRAAALT